jgi:hypothetical protein
MLFGCLGCVEPGRGKELGVAGCCWVLLGVAGLLERRCFALQGQGEIHLLPE